MGHDGVHNFLDMAFRTIGGDKKAYSRYKRRIEREKRPHRKYDDNGAPIGKPNQFDNLPHQRQGPHSDEDSHGLYPRKFYSRSEDQRNGRLGPQLQSGRSGLHHVYPPVFTNRGHHLRPGGPHGGPAPCNHGYSGQRNSVQSGNPPQGYQVPSPRFYPVSAPNATAPRNGMQPGYPPQGYQVPSPGLYPGSAPNAAAPRNSSRSGHKNGPTGSRPGSKPATTGPSERVHTSVYKVGDMTRSFIEGMVPDD